MTSNFSLQTSNFGRHGVAEPVFEVSEHWVTTVFPRPTVQAREQVGTKLGPGGGRVPGEVTGEVNGEQTQQGTPQVTPQVRRLLSVLHGEKSRGELLDSLGLKDRMHFANEYLLPALENGWIEMTIPEKPRSSKQKYRLTAKGKALVSEFKGKAGGSY